MKKVVNAVLESKKFAFDTEELDSMEIDHESRFFQKVGANFRLKVTSDFTQMIIVRLEERFRPSYNADFLSFYNFYRQIDEYFDISKSSSQGRSAHIKAILQYLILKANKEFGIQFDRFICTLWSEIDPFESNEFNLAFSKVLGQLQIQPANLHSSLLCLYTGTDGEPGYNMDRAIITGGIQEYCENNYEEGKVLLDLYENGSDELIISHHAAILAGLYRCKTIKGLDRLKSYVGDKKFEESVGSAIAVINPKSVSEIKSLLDLMNSLNWRIDSIMTYVPRAIVNFLNSELSLGQELTDACFNKLGQAIQSENIYLSKQGLWQIQFLKGYDEQIFDLIQPLAEEEKLKYVSKEVDNLLRRLDSNDYLFKFIRLIKIQSMNGFRSDILEYSLNHFRSKHELEFSNGLISLLIDDVGMNRWKGQRIYSHFAIRSYSSFLFKTDLTQLPALNQYKLIVSVLSDFIEPKYCLASILPLRRTKYSLVYEILLAKLESLIENFSSSVLVECTKHLDLSSDLDSEIIDRIKNGVKDFDRYCKIKNNITEFNPMLTKASIYKEYMSVIMERMAETSRATEPGRDSFLNYFQTVKLAKGGRWIGSEDNRKTELNQYRSSFQLPRDCHRIPERFEMDIAKEYTKDWSAIFKPWEQIISS